MNWQRSGNIATVNKSRDTVSLMSLDKGRQFFRSEVLATSVVVIFLLFFLGGTGFVIRNAYRATNDIARVQAISSAEVVAANFEWVTQTSRQLLQRVDDFVGPNLDALPQNALRFMKDSISTLPGAPRIYLVRADGVTALTTDPDFKPIDIRDRDYFKAVADGAQSYISPMLVSRLNGEQIFVMSKRIERNGIFIGAAIVSFNSELIERVWKTLRFDQSSAVLVVRDDGQVVTRYPLLEGPMDISKSDLFTIHLPLSESGIYEAVSVADGVKRIVAYRRVPGSHLIATAALGSAMAFTPFYRFAMLSLAVALPIVLFLAYLAWVTFTWLTKETKQRNELAAALESNQMLFREIHHRVKNNLQAVNSLINLQKIDPNTKMEMSQRVMAMIAVHEQIYRNDQFSLVDASAYIPAIVDRLIESYGRDVEVAYDLQAIEVDREHALPLGLITNEVISNAIKHAFPDGGKGKLTISFKKLDDGHNAELRLADDGVGFDPSHSAKGMGSRLLGGLAAQIGGSYEFKFENGTTFVLKFPLPANQQS
jgi:two-component system, sensor histidine kinase PdtaS